MWLILLTQTQNAQFERFRKINERKSMYKIMYVDCPVRYDNPRGNKPSDGGITYPTMSLNDLKRIPVHKICDKNCVLFIWATMPKLQEVLEIIDAWGFKYTTCAFTWIKLNRKSKTIYSGLGHWTNGNAEVCLFAKRGRPKRLAKNVKQVIMAPLGRHSAKPPEIRDRIVSLMGDIPRIELFARETALGWDSVGNEIDGKDVFEAIDDIYNQKILKLDEDLHIKAA